MSLLNLMGVGYSVAELAELKARTNDVIATVRSAIEAEGGTVRGVASLNSRLILRSPFPSKPVRLNRIGGRPVILRVTCAYATDAGHWLIHSPADGEIDWVWCSDTGLDDLPAPRHAGRVAHGVVVFPLWAGAILYLGLVALVFALVIHFFGNVR